MTDYVPDFVLIDDTEWKAKMIADIDWDTLASFVVEMLNGEGDIREARNVLQSKAEKLIYPYTFDQMMEHGSEEHLTPRFVAMMKAQNAAPTVDGNHRSAAMRGLRRKRR